MAICRFVCQTLKDAPVLLLYCEAGRCLKQIEPKAKAKKKLIVATLRGYQRMGIRHSPRIVSVKYSPYDCCLERSTNYEMEKKIEKYGTLESSALLYFSKVSSSSACLMEAG